MIRRFLPLCLVAGLLSAAGVNPADLDRSVKPCQDFFRFANGGWLARNPIPAEYPAWGGFAEVAERNRNVLKEILEAAAADRTAPKGSVARQVGDFYAAGMDEKGIEKAGLRPLQGALAALKGLRMPKDLARVLADLHAAGSGAGFGFGVGQDDKVSTAYIAQFAQGGLALPDRDYYLKEDPQSVDLRSAYREHVARTFVLLGEKPAEAQRHAWIVLDLETRLARASMTRVEQRDPNAIYHKMAMKDLAAQAPGFDWPTYFKGIGLKDGQDVLVRQPGFFKAFGEVAGRLPMADWQTYLRFHLAASASPYLTKAFENEHFAFFGKRLNGSLEIGPRWKRVQQMTDGCLGEALGQLYVKRTFSPRAKARMLEMVENLRAALRERIEGLDWMTAATKQAALQKLAAFTVKIGYPDQWRSYAALQVSREGYLGNVERAARFEFHRQMAKLGGPIDRAEWDMTPPTVNAYYNPNLNEIVFPAGILQAPFFDEAADDAVNYGAIGMVIGHEMTHGFDDEGRQFDAQGNLRDWWTEADVKAYEARTDLVVRQYDALEVLPGLHVNGRLTLGENIADLGGLKIAYAAWQRTLRGKPRPADIDGFTPEQRFFLGYAQSWHFHAREERIRMNVNVDPHSPPRFRVNAPLANLPEFIQAFGCPEGEPMSRPSKDRPAIW